MALFKQMGLICEDSIVHPDMNEVLNDKLGTSQVDYPSSKWADKVAVLGDPLPSKTASGNIAHFEDGADNVPLDTGLFYFNPIQASGTPTPSSPIAIYGHTGLNIYKAKKNLFDKANLNTTLNCYITSNTVKTSSSNRVVFIACNPSTTYTVSKTAGQRFVVGYSTELPANDVALSGVIGDNNASSITITTGSNAKYVVAWVWSGANDSNTAQEMLESVQIEQSNSATTFEAYEGTTYPVSWSEHGTVYGGYYNSVTGELWKTYESEVFNGAESETWAVYGSQNGFTKTISNMKSGSAMLNGYSNFLATINTYTGFGIRFGGNNNSTIYLCHITDNITGVSDVESWKTYLQTHNLQVVYPLATPVLVGIIDPTKIKTYEGVNNIWNDGGGDSEVGYRSKASGGVGTPTFIETVLAEDTNLTGTLDFDGADYNDYDLIRCELYNDYTLKNTSVLLTPQTIADMFANLSNGICFNEYANNQYAYYNENSSGNWIRGGNRNLWVKKVYGIVGDNCSISVTNLFRLQADSPTYQPIITSEDLFEFDYIVASCRTGSDGVPCVYVLNTGKALGDMADYFYPNVANAYNSYSQIEVTQHQLSDYYWYCVDGITFT